MPSILIKIMMKATVRNFDDRKVQREDIHIIGRHSDLTEKGVAKALKENVYNDKEAWQKLFQLLFISLGVGFAVSGIVFFFAYNWADLHKFAKMGMAEGLIIVTTIFALLPKININIRNIILTGASVLVGVLFAVYGQIYQTGANAYDFFLGWTVFVTLWVAVSNFAPLWLLYLVLVNTTFILYSQQVAKDWSDIFIFTSLFIFNTIALISAIAVSKLTKKINISNWFLYIVALSCIIYATIGIIIGIFDYKNFSLVLSLTTITTFALGIWYGLKTKNRFYLSAIPFSLVVIMSALLLKASTEFGMFLFVSLFVIGSVTLIIKVLIGFQKNNGRQSLAIKILSVFGGILASLAFLGFLFIAGLYDSEVGLFIVGAIFIAGAIFTSKKHNKKIILDTIIVSFFAIGFLLLGFAFATMDMNVNAICVLFIIIALSAIIIAQNYILSFISTLLISGSILSLIVLNNSYGLIHIYIAAFVAIIAYFFLNEAKIITTNNSFSKLYNPIRTGLAFSFLAGLAFVGKKGLLPISTDYIWISSLVTISAVIYLLRNLFEVLNINKTQHKVGIYIFAILALLPTAFSPAIASALVRNA